MSNKNYLEKYIEKRGYKVDVSALETIKITDSWYTNSENAFHKQVTVNGEPYDLERMNFAKRLCADDANLVEMIDVRCSASGQSDEVIKNILSKNKFNVQYRKQVEEMSANGTVGAYVWLDNASLYEDGTIRGGDVRIEYCRAKDIYPLSVVNDEIIEVAFCGSYTVKGKPRYKIVMYLLHEGEYIVETHVFNETGKELTEELQLIQLGDVKPFAIMRVAENNNLKMKGYGFPKLLNAIPCLKVIDMTVTMWGRDLSKADKIVLINECLTGRDAQGNPKPLTPQMKNIFVQIGANKLPEEKSLVQEYNPEIRIDSFVKSLEVSLSVLSMLYGFGTKKYTFEKGRIVTASEYVGEKQDSMQEINKQRAESINYISDIVKAIAYFYEISGQGVLDVSDIEVDFDDSFIEDKTSVLESLKSDALSFGVPKLTELYLSKKYGFTPEEVKELMEERPLLID